MQMPDANKHNRQDAQEDAGSVTQLLRSQAGAGWLFCYLAGLVDINLESAATLGPPGLETTSSAFHLKSSDVIAQPHYSSCFPSWF